MLPACVSFLNLPHEIVSQPQLLDKLQLRENLRRQLKSSHLHVTSTGTNFAASLPHASRNFHLSLATSSAASPPDCQPAAPYSRLLRAMPYPRYRKLQGQYLVINTSSMKVWRTQYCPCDVLYQGHWWRTAILLWIPVVIYIGLEHPILALQFYSLLFDLAVATWLHSRDAAPPVCCRLLLRWVAVTMHIHSYRCGVMTHVATSSNSSKMFRKPVPELAWCM